MDPLCKSCPEVLECKGHCKLLLDRRISPGEIFLPAAGLTQRALELIRQRAFADGIITGSIKMIRSSGNRFRFAITLDGEDLAVLDEDLIVEEGESLTLGGRWQGSVKYT